MTHINYCVDVAAAIAKLTVSGKIKWTQLSLLTDNEQLRAHLISKNKYIYSNGNHPIIAESSSYTCPHKSGYAYFFTYVYGRTHDRFYTIAIQANKQQPIQELNDRSAAQIELSGLLDQIVDVREDELNIDFIMDIISAADND